MGFTWNTFKTFNIDGHVLAITPNDLKASAW